MIALAIARRNFSCSISKPNSFISKSRVSFCNSNVSLFPSISSFTTSTGGQDVTSSTVYDVLVHKHNFSPESATLVASNLTKRCIPEKADSILSLFKENGFSITQLQKIVTYKPRILGVSDEDVRIKFKIFRDLGFCSKDIAKLFAQNPSILHLNASTKIIPTLSVLKGLLGSDEDVARILRRSAWFLFVDLEKSLLSNVETLKSCGIPMEDIRYFISKFPRCFLKQDVLRKSIVKAKDMGGIQSPKMFILAIGVIASTSEQTWELKRRALQELGFSVSDILEMFKKAPPAFCVSTVKIKKVTGLLLATGKFDISSIATYPSSFGRSIEKRFKPRLQILEILESRNLIDKWPSLSTISVFPDHKFFQTFIEPHSDQLEKHLLLRLMPKTKNR